MSTTDTLRALEAAATPGPWFTGETDDPDLIWDHAYGPDGDIVFRAYGNLGIDPERSIDADDNARLLVALRNAAPALLDVAEAAQAYRLPAEGLRAALLSLPLPAARDEAYVHAAASVLLDVLDALARLEAA